ncbi:GntR family transcriptional regulator [Synergistales bacterium]|nr:GntR family transcriptional regulator [Synergistales bacterium]
MRTRFSNASSAKYAYGMLRRKIFNREFEPGEHLPEIAIANEFQVSRTPIREAFRWLANEGLINIFPHEGASVINPSKEERRDTFEVRAYLECLAFKRAATRITPLQLCMLEEEIAKEEISFAEQNLETYLEINNSFHKIIAQASGNVALYELIANILSRTLIYLVLFESFFDFDSNPSLDEHRELVKFLKTKDEVRGIALIKKHITS